MLISTFPEELIHQQQMMKLTFGFESLYSPALEPQISFHYLFLEIDPATYHANVSTSVSPTHKTKPNQSVNLILFHGLLYQTTMSITHSVQIVLLCIKKRAVHLLGKYNINILITNSILFVSNRTAQYLDPYGIQNFKGFRVSIDSVSKYSID